MGLMCKLVKGTIQDPLEESQIYRTLYNITKDEDLSSFIWGLSQNRPHLSKLGLSTTEDSTPKEFFKKHYFVEDMLDSTEGSKINNIINDRDTSVFRTHSDALYELENTQKDFPKYSFKINTVEKGFTVTADTKTAEDILAKEKALSVLNGKLLSYIEKLGFAVKEVEGLDTPGVFSAKDAVKNTEGLIEAIKISKGQQGQEAIPEEVSHLLAAGLYNHPLVKRLYNAMTYEVVQEILGEDFEVYKNKYNSEERLKEEAVGRLIAQNLINRAGLQNSIKYISNKVLDVVQGNLQKGEPTVLQQYIQEALSVTDQIVDAIESEEILIEFDKKLALKSEDLYHLNKSLENTKQVLENAYETLSKRIKILSFSSSDAIDQQEDKKLVEQLEKDLENLEYSKGCFSFIDRVVEDCQDMYDSINELEKKYEDPNITNNKIKKAKLLADSTRILNQIRIFIDAYKDSISNFTALAEISDIEEYLTAVDIQQIEETAKQVQQQLKRIEKNFKQLRFNTLLEYYKQFWKKDIPIKTIEGSEEFLTLEDILQSQLGDTTGFDRLVGSVGDSKDPLLQMVYNSFHRACQKRNSEIEKIRQRMGQIHQRYYEKTNSNDTSFVLEYDEKGIPTGMFLSPYDYNAYGKAKQEKIQELKNLNLSKKDYETQLHLWEDRELRLVDVGDGVKTKVPINFKSNKLQNLNEAQMEYYTSMMQLKKELCKLVPGGRYNYYMAPQKQKDIIDTVTETKSIKKTVKRLKEQYIGAEINDSDYGSAEIKDGKYVVLNFNNEEVKKVPCYYTTRLEDMSLLDTNITDTMNAYAAMAINYTHMSKLSETLELTNSLMQDRDIVQYQGDKKLFQRFKVGEATIQSDYTKKGSESQVGKQLQYFIDANLYDRRKKIEQTSIKLADKEVTINYGQLGDTAKAYSTALGMGMSIFSATTNITMGESQLLREAIAGEYFGFKDLLWAKKEYAKLRPKNAANAYKNNPDDKLSLLLKRFNMLNDVEHETKDTKYNNGLFRKIVDKFNLLLGNQLGEHYLQSVGMLAVLKATKIKIDGIEMSAYDALEEKEFEHKVDEFSEVNKTKTEKTYTYKTLVFKGAPTDLEDRTLNFSDLELRIKQTNRYMHGGFEGADKGAIYNTALGRNIMNFRQWMPAVYTSRLGKEKIDTLTGQKREGSYRTSFSFVLGTITDLMQLKFNILSRYKELSKHQQANLWRTIFDASLLALLTFITGKFDDDEDVGVVNLFKYNLYRLKMETGAMIPSLQFKDSITMLIKSPLPAMESINNVIGLLDLTLLTEEVGSGRYEGWSKWAKQLYLAIPGSRNVTRFIDMLEGNTSMFKPYKAI